MQDLMEATFVKGIEAHKNGHLEEAVKQFNEVLSADPHHVGANHSMGLIAVGVQDYKNGLDFFERGIQADPTEAKLWVGYIETLIKSGRIEDAKKTLEFAKGKGAQGKEFDKFENCLLSTVQDEHRVTTLESSKNQTTTLSSVDTALKKAKKLVKSGELKDAEEMIHHILRKFPDNKRVQKFQANLGNGKLKPKTSSKTLSDDQKAKLQNLFYMGNFLEVIENIESLLEANPNSTILLNMQGASYAKLRRFNQAIACFEKAIKIKPNLADSYNNLGIVHRETEDFDTAISKFTKAIKLRPNYAEAWNNLGVAQINYGLCEDAIKSYKRAILIKPSFADAQSNLGVALEKIGQTDEAIKCFRLAISANPNDPVSCNNLGLALYKKGDTWPAIDFFKATLRLQPDSPNGLRALGVAIRNQRLTQSDPELEQLVCKLLQHKSYIRPKDISTTVISVIKRHSAIKKWADPSDLELVKSNWNLVIADIGKLPILLDFMSVCPVPDISLEKLLTALRASLLFNHAAILDTDEYLEFQIALALHCFVNEYVYSVSIEEERTLLTLKQGLERSISLGKVLSPAAILILASYEALNNQSWAQLLTDMPSISKVTQQQITEVCCEDDLKPEISQLEMGEDDVSKRVRAQYEQNPYPRWVNIGLPLTPSPIMSVIEELNLKVRADTLLNVQAPKVLVAGCGTGQHSIDTASRFKNSQVTAIDLSLSSLAYAKRKTSEFKLRNVEYLQGNILKLSKLEKQFDLVESCGVIHHMDDPMEGWKVLTDLLKPGGLMKIGLYSELARQNVTKIRQEIKTLGVAATDRGMMGFRQSVISSNKAHHIEIVKSPDFYSLSTVRDLLFHEQEHLFTLPMICSALERLGLVFCGFESEQVVSKFKTWNGNSNALYEIDKWYEFEQENPNIFGGMYQFWCQKAL